MDVTSATLPGVATVHQCVTRDGRCFGVLVEKSGRRRLLFYDPAEPDTVLQAISLEQCEADQLADILHSRPVLDRLADLERRFTEFTEFTQAAFTEAAR
ncbi:hypothetical protein DI270_035800 [Microbispora triticiradicis]|uniref:Potassium/proton antiporter subunit KhtT-like N-terminal domain-containing protein n=3 Tax=Microbispora TaxID=2005 RepID=A0ABY3LXW5_9ACTN|nr:MULTISPECIES: hypothetical protein [Microbispora]RGA00249.1 hypothetical protein DI270_035800 [Microbispora triticiradicis]TLP58546.1 hypothetical protein FED44_16845 [Microbispora fusca]TYB59288.1 hypothetical protein FXF59_14865 [Microbispora tritici]GLW21200.1 hypothetical protein Mame01_12430 [Microbispora amethystogenes]